MRLFLKHFKMKRFLLIIPCLILIGQGNAQQKSGFRPFKRVVYDSNYVNSFYDHYLHVTLISNSQNLFLNIKNNTNTQSVTYKPNNVFRFGLSLDYNIFSLEYTHSLDVIDAPDPGNGKTESFSLRLGLTGRRIVAGLLSQRYKGMYIDNAGELMRNGIGIPSKLRPDIQSEMVLGSFNYFFNNHKYSTMASLWQIDKQKKSAGSFVAGITSSIMHFSADSSFFPSSYITNSLSDRIVDNYSYIFGINGGYAYNLIIRKKCFVNVMLIPGVNLQFGNNIDTQNKIYYYREKFGYHADARFIAGYNGDIYYFGVHSANYFISNSVKDNVDVKLSNTYFRIFFGRRFYVPLPVRNKKK